MGGLLSRPGQIVVSVGETRSSQRAQSGSGSFLPGSFFLFFRGLLAGILRLLLCCVLWRLLLLGLPGLLLRVSLGRAEAEAPVVERDFVMSVRELPDQIDEDNAADGKGFAVVPALQGLEDFFDKFHGFLLLINCGRWTAVDFQAELVAERRLASLLLLLWLQPRNPVHWMNGTEEETVSEAVAESTE